LNKLSFIDGFKKEVTRKMLKARTGQHLRFQITGLILRMITQALIFKIKELILQEDKSNI
jgi:hypothetical protein